MADFKIADAITANTEGGYDHGTDEAETAFGIDRSQNPNWSGWIIVDQVKKANPGADNHKMTTILRAYPTFMSAVQLFRKRGWWDPLKLDAINDQQVANNTYDCSINQGSGIAAKFLQEASGATVDGEIGPASIAAVNNGNAETIFNKINELRKSRYENTHGFAIWKDSWLGRLIDYKTST